MIKNAIDDHAHTHFVRGINELFKIFVCSKAWVDMIIVNQIIFVIFTSGENWIQIDTVEAQRFYVVEVFHYTANSSAKPRFGRYAITGCRSMWVRGQCSLAACKTVRENVIYDCVLKPMGNIADFFTANVWILIKFTACGWECVHK